jgi:multidrug efflux pump subunit AcrA (membrane-fusion protein)
MTIAHAHFTKAHEAQLQFLRLSARLEERATPYLVRRTSFVLSAVVLLFIGWAAVTQIEEITQSPGEVVPFGFTQIIQHFDGGIVREIPVLEGAFVKEGDVLLRLDGAGAQEDLNKAVIARNGLQAAAKTGEELFLMQEELKTKGVSSQVRYLESKQALNRTVSELEQQKEVVSRMEERVRRLVITARVTGLVKGMKVNTIGAVVKPGEPLMEIMPTSKTLVVEAHLNPADIGNVAVGQPVKVKVSSYDYGRFGVVDGTLEFVTATTFSEEGGGKYYRARIILKQDHVGTHEEMKILPGMTVQAGIITGKKTVLEYLVKPVQRALKDALSER